MRCSLILLLTVFLVHSSAWASNYSSYDKSLATYWPIPNAEQGECQVHDPSYWMQRAQRFISVEPIAKYIALNDDEIMVLRNLLISQAYNRLFIYSLNMQQLEQPQIKFFWIAAGSLSSVTVGHALQEGLASKYSKGTRQRAIFESLESLHTRAPLSASILLRTIPEVKRKTAENNWRVYSDILWQHLAYIQCGFDEVKLLNQKLIVEQQRRGDLEKADHYQRFIYMWTDIDKGLYLEASMKLVYIEQHNILQKYMYDGWDAKVANGLLFFNGLAKADLSGPHGRPIQSFTDFSLTNDLYPDLGYFPTRFKWMKYVVSEQAQYLEELKTPENAEAALEKALYESYQTVKQYQKYLP